MDIQKIMQLLPHRYPFLLVDRVTEVIPGKELTGYKNISINEPFFQGHFPQEPVMPGVLILEALAQATAVGLAVREGLSGGVGYFAAIDDAKFKRKVVPGDQLRLTGTILLFRRGLCKVDAKAFVGDELAAEGQLTFVFPNK